MKWFIALLWIVPLLTVSSVQAHNTIDAANVQMAWHTDTNELLQVDADTTLTLSLRVNGHPLALSHCRCTLLLYSGEVNPRIRPSILKLEQGLDGDWFTIVTVTKTGEYSLFLDGKPLVLSEFTPFRLTFTLTAAEDVNNIPQSAR